MPKIVDHEQRRRAIADEVLRGAATHGLDGVSMRSVASRLGLSLGAVQHYFPTREAMLAHAVAEIGRRRDDRVRAELAALGEQPSERAILRATALAGMPLDDTRRQECLAEMAFLGHLIPASASGTAAPPSGVGELIGFIETLLRTTGERGELAEGADPHREAIILWTIMSSAAQGILVGFSDPRQVVATLDYWLDRVLPLRRSTAEEQPARART